MLNYTLNISGMGHYGIKYIRVQLEIFTAISLIACVTNLLIIFSILKNKKLKTNVTNVIIGHIKIIEAMFLLVTPLTCRIYMTFSHLSHLSTSMFWGLYQTQILLGCSVCLFLVLLVFDGHLKLYHNNLHETFCGVYKYYVIGIYILLIGLSLVTSIFWVENWVLIFIIVNILLNLGLFPIFLIIMNIIHTSKKTKLTNFETPSNLGLAISNIFIFCYIPCIISFLISAFYNIVNIFIFICSFNLIFLCPIFTFVYLINQNTDFCITFGRVFRCQNNNSKKAKSTKNDNTPVTYYNIPNNLSISGH